jgi:hypothetical protein
MTTANVHKEDKQKIWDEQEAADAAKASGVLPQAAAETPPAEATTPAKEAAAPATADEPKVAAEPAKDDPYASLNPVVADTIRGMQSMMEQYAAQLRSANGHIGGLTSQLKALKEAQSTVKAAGGDAPTATQLQAARGDAGAMAKLKADYPEFASALDAALEERLKPVQEQLTAKPAVADGEQPMTRKEYADLLVEEKHEGWKEVVKTPAFRGWLETQPQEVKALGASASPRDAIRLLDLHKEARKSTGQEQEDQARLEAAAAIPNGRRQPSQVRTKSLDQMTRAELWAYYDEQDRQAALAAAR